MFLGKAAETIDQPFGGEVRRCAHGKRTRALALEQPLGADRNAIESIAQDYEVFAPGLGDHESLALPIEELEAELQFQGLNLVAHRTLGDEQLLGRPREAFMARGSLEGLEGVEGRQAPKHRPPS